MKLKLFILLFAMHCALSTKHCFAQSSATMQVWKSGSIINTIPLSDIDSITFTPCYSNCGKVKDFDGNIYSTVIIGTQCWMQSNLNTTHYRNGDSIPNVKNDNAWDNLTTGAYCNYDNDTNNAKIYGKLYNGYAALDSNKICPTGWHVPSDSEWTVLVTYLGGDTIAGGKMKEAGTSHWQTPNIGATNSSGFTALPAGCREFGIGDFSGLGGTIMIWSSTEEDVFSLWDRQVVNNSTSIYRGWPEEIAGFSVRCVKGN